MLAKLQNRPKTEHPGLARLALINVHAEADASKHWHEALQLWPVLLAGLRPGAATVFEEELFKAGRAELARAKEMKVLQDVLAALTEVQSQGSTCAIGGAYCFSSSGDTERGGDDQARCCTECVCVCDAFKERKAEASEEDYSEFL